MKKQDFLIKLKERLIERGLAADSAEKETEHVRTYLSESGMEELDISVDEMADGIISMLGEGEKSEMPIPIAVPLRTESESVSDEFGAAIAAMEGGSLEPSEEQPERASDEIPIVIDPETEFISENSSDEGSEPKPDPEPEPEPIVPISQERNENKPEKKKSKKKKQQKPVPAVQNEPETEETKDDAQNKIEEETKEQPAVIEETPEDDEENAEIEEFLPAGKKDHMKKTSNKKKNPANDWLYVALLVVTIPIAVALVIIAVALYIGCWIALALGIIACVALLVVFVAAGAVVSLVGIVYGVVQLITGLVPVGMFEIGLGVVVGAAVMFIGILVYNFAVRFIPFGMKMLAKLFRVGFGAMKSGYLALKGAVESV